MRLTFQPDQYSNYPVSPDGGSTWHHMSDALHESIYRVLALLISILPGLFALIIAVGVMVGIGMLLSAVLRRGLSAARFDERLARRQASGIADWSPSHSPTALVGRCVFWG